MTRIVYDALIEFLFNKVRPIEAVSTITATVSLSICRCLLTNHYSVNRGVCVPSGSVCLDVFQLYDSAFYFRFDVGSQLNVFIDLIQ
jgi:hypothetical protein